MCLHLRQTFCQIPIHLNCTTLSAPVDDLFTESHHCLFVLWRAHWDDVDTDQTAFSSQRKLIITQSAFFPLSLKKKTDLVLRKETEGKWTCFAFAKNVFIVYLCMLQKHSSWSQCYNPKHRNFALPNPMSSLKTAPRMNNI